VAETGHPQPARTAIGVRAGCRVAAPVAAANWCRIAPSVWPPEAQGYQRSTKGDKEDPMGDGKADEMKGRAKEALGDLTDDQSLENEGKVDKAVGKVKDKVDDMADKVKDKT
jgi:uncharacterized protein YjbJ (UPF0337 family)